MCIRAEIPQLKQVLAWARPQCAKSVLNVKDFVRLRRLIAMLATVLMLWQTLETPLQARGLLGGRIAIATSVVTQTPGDVDASGSFTASNRTMLFYQRGTEVSGEYTYGSTKYAFTGTVNGYTLTGKIGTYNFSATYAADGLSFTGSDSWGKIAATKQSTAIIRVIPIQAVVKVGGSLTIDGLVGGVPDKGITWTASGGSVADGVFTAPTTAGLYTVTATSIAQPSVKATTTIQATNDSVMDASGSFTASSRTMLFYQRGTEVSGEYTYGSTKYAFTGTVNGYTLTGKIGTYNFSATYAADGLSFTGSDSWGKIAATKQSTAIIRVIPIQAVVKVGGSLTIDGLVGGVPDKGITWTASGGSVADGVFTAPTTAGLYTVTATSIAQPSVKATTTIQATNDSVMDASGSFTASSRTMLFYQRGTEVTGEYTYGSTKYAFTGTVNGYTLTGKIGTYNFSATYAADGLSFTGSDSWGKVAATKLPTISIRIVPSESKALKFGDSCAYLADVAGTYHKGVIWSATAGTIIDGLYTAPAHAGVHTIMAASQAALATTAEVKVYVDTWKAPVASWNFNEGTSLIAGDASGHGFSGVLMNGPSWVDGKQSKGLRFDGKTAYVSVPLSDVFKGSFTVSAWVKLDEASMGKVNTVLGYGTQACNQALHCAINSNGKPYFGFYCNDLPGNAPLSAGVWTHLAFTYDGAKKRIYVNGVLDASHDSAPLTGIASNTVIGRRSFDMDEYFLGLLDEVQVFDRALTDVEVEALHASTVNITVAPRASTLAVGQSQTFTAKVVGNTDTTATWELPDAGSGSITPLGVYTAPATVAASGSTFRVVARSVADATQADTVTVTVKPFVRVWPESITVAANGTYLFQAEVTGLPDTQVTWSATGGAFSGNVYKAPSSTGTYTLTATSVADPTKQAIATVKVVSGNMPVNSDLVGYWKFDRNTQDSSKFGNHGIASGSATFTTGKSSSAMRFNGLDTYVDIPSVNPFTGPFTVAAWVKFDAVNRGLDNAILGQGTRATNQALHLGERNGKAYFSFYNNDLSGHAALQPGIWTHLAFVFDGTQKRIYINGVLDAAQNSASFQSAMANARIGRYQHDTSCVCLGLIDELQVYNCALTDAEVTGVFTARINVFVTPRNAVVALGQTQTFGASVTGHSDQAVTWSVTSANGGTIDAAGLYTSPATISYHGVPYTVKAVSQASAAQSDSVQVTVKYPVYVTPKTLTLPANGVAAFSAETTGLSSDQVDWTASAGTITSAGIFTAPAASGMVTITATSAADGTKLDTATVKVVKPSAQPDVLMAFDEGSGTTTVDAMGSGVVGTLRNSPAWMDGRIGKALDFTSNAVVTLDPVVGLGSAWTIAAWFQYPLPNTGNYHTLTRGYSGDHQILVHTDQVRLGSYDSAAGFRDSGFKMNTLTAGWHHVAAVGSGGTTQFHIDGLPVGSPIPWQSRSDVYAIGNYQSGGQPFGLVDEVKIFRRAMSQAEITSLASGIRVQILPAETTLDTGGTQTFTATVAGVTTQTVTWELPDSGSGSITSKGVYTAPARVPYDGVRYRVIARSKLDPAQTAVGWVTVHSADPARLPLLHLPFNEGAGDQTMDMSGHGFAGSLINGPSWELAGRVGKAIRLNGTQAVKVPAFPAFKDAFSVSIWLYPTDKGTRNPEGGILVNREGELEIARFQDGTIRYALANTAPGWSAPWVNTGIVAPLSQWTHIVWAYSAAAGTIKTYVNGALVHMLTGSGAIGDADTGRNELWIGGRQRTDLKQYFQGVLDEVRLYDRAISDSEASALHDLAAVEIYPVEAGVWAAKKAVFRAAVPDLADQSVTWELPMAGSGTVEADGTYTAPSSVSGGDTTFPILARSVADPTRTGTATIRLRGYTAQDPALVGYWPFNEYTGTTVLDSSRSANHGALTDGPVKRLSGRKGYALFFDGANNGRVTIPDHPAMNPRSLTLSMWLRLDQDPAFDGSSNSWRSLLHKGDFYGGSTGYAAVLQKDCTIGFYTGTGTQDSWSPQGLQLTVGQWSHVVLAYDATTGLKAAYQDGKLVDTKRIAPKPLQSNTAPLYVNNNNKAFPAGGYGNFPGMIDEFRVYDRALAMADVSALYAQVVTVLVQPQDVVLVAGQTQPFKAVVGGDTSQAVHWSVLDSSGGTIDATGLYTAPASIATQGVRYRVRAQSQAVPSATSTVYVTVKHPVYVTPATTTVPMNGSSAFSAEVTGLSSGQVTWAASAGAITFDGVFTAPAAKGTVTITATSVADPTRSATAIVTVSSASTAAAAHFPFEEGGGTATMDVSGHGTVGNFEGAVGWVPGRTGSAVRFDGTDGCILLSPAVDLGKEWTLSTWFQYPVPDSGNSYSVLVRSVEKDCPILVRKDGALGTWSESSFFDSGYRMTELTAGWHHLAAVGLNGRTQFYLDGVAVGSATGYQSQRDVWAIGAFRNLNPSFGAIDDFKVFNRALGPVEVAGLHASGVVVGLSPATATLILGQSQAFTATVANSTNQGVTWELPDAGSGSITSGGVYTAPASIPSEGQVYRIVARSRADARQAATAFVTVRSPIVVSPGAVVAPQGGMATFSAVTANLASPAVRWSASGGSIHAETGAYIAPHTAGMYTITATSVSDPSKTGTATVVVPLGVRIVPAKASLLTNSRLQFQAVVTGAANQGVDWSLWEGHGGVISGTGLYTAPAAPGIFHVNATARADAKAAGNATVAVVKDGSYQVDPESITVKPGATVSFRILGPDVASATVTWQTGGGSITPEGVLTAPIAPGSFNVIALVATDTVQVVSARVTVSEAASVESVVVTPSQIDLGKGGTTIFTARVNGGVTGGVTWSCTGGSIDPATGAYTAPEALGTYTVRATSTEDSNAYGIATVTVRAQAGEDRMFTYDENGNMTSDGERTFEWDAENRLVAVVIVATGHRSEFGYDGLGRRVQIIEKDLDVNQTLQATSDKKYLWDGVEIAEERDATGGIVLKRFFAQGFVDSDGMVLYYTRDHLGSIRELTDSSQTVRARYEYDPYGRITKIQGDKDSPFTYTGHFWHAQSGLFLTLYRAYDPNLGRWISRDLIEEEGGINLYCYALNAPSLYRDKLGDKVYVCERPLNGPLNKLKGRGPFYHKYYCIDVGGNKKCYGQTSKGNPLWPGPGRPTTPDEDVYNPEKCKEVPITPCEEACLRRKGESKRRPGYGIGPGPTDCQEWVDDNISDCKKECKMFPNGRPWD